MRDIKGAIQTKRARAEEEEKGTGKNRESNSNVVAEEKRGIRRKSDSRRAPRDCEMKYRS